MRRKVRGTVSGIYICRGESAEMCCKPHRLSGCSRSCNKTGFRSGKCSTNRVHITRGCYAFCRARTALLSRRQQGQSDNAISSGA